MPETPPAVGTIFEQLFDQGVARQHDSQDDGIARWLQFGPPFHETNAHAVQDITLNARIFATTVTQGPTCTKQGPITQAYREPSHFLWQEGRDRRW